MLRQEKTQIILSNTYHLLLQPGPQIVEKLGGVQKMSGWRGPMLTDSGGYQIFSMGFGSVSQEVKGSRGSMGWSPSLESINELGAKFKNYRDGTWCCLTPESSIAAQRCIGADLVVVLDECTPFHVTKDYTEQSMHRSHRWALRSLEEFIRGDDGSQALYGIIQGGVYKDLRRQAASFVNDWPFFGHAIGGSLGDSKTTMYDIVSETASLLRRDRPIHLLGIGSVKDIFAGVRMGIDTFDCVHPTRIARHGGALVKAHHWEEEGALSHDSLPREHTNLMRARYRDDDRPIDSSCECYTCQNFSRGYIRHLLKADESLAGTLLTVHNIHYMNKLMAAVREAIRKGTLDEEEKLWLHPRTSSTF
uniref:tRNA-guanine(15) transglycosylase-like domain-containing protein n=1 Tax=Pinguiococcus pyrenoidosus TaxID=172671 RepID=A0A7R9UGF4_9STRA|mmetsp:Transcript_9189/g.34561  ORF Transcript_9189/g.34561 Transcript_9189/m.34561 type:complete len:362 (+) Transcript_9189:149-1234(+)